jgi:nitrite reductase/ring-hydroxylating ferredoxin subunit
VEGAVSADCWRGARLEPGRGARFRLTRNGKSVEGFVVNHRGEHHAYVNRCPHAGTTLDLWPNEFFTEDARYLICATHGAIFDPPSGLCVGGPCPGARLESLAVAIDGDVVVVTDRR